MKLTTRLIILFAASFCIYSCSNNDTKSKELSEIMQPDFTDGGKTIDSLKKVYNCESIDYENWSDKKAVDSCLTVCLINSTKVPSGGDVDEDANQIKSIALTIRNSLTKPQNYKSYYIIFVKKENINGQETKVHSAGMEIPSTQL